MKLYALYFVLLLLPAFGEHVEIADSNVEEAIRIQLRKPLGPISHADLRSITELDLSLRKLTSLSLPEGLECLTKLDLSWNDFEELPTFEGEPLPVTWLSFSRNDLGSELVVPESFSRQLPKLEYLSFSNNSIYELQLPKGLSHLKTLSAGGNSLTRLDLPEGLVSLSVLGLSSNSRLSNLTIPPDSINLSRLDLWQTGFEHVDFLDGLVNLESLQLTSVFLTSVALPSSLKNLVELHLFDSGLEHLIIPEGLSKLEILDLRNCRNLETLTLPPDTNLKELDVLYAPIETWMLRLPMTAQQRVEEKLLRIIGFPLNEILYYDVSPLAIDTRYLPGSRQLVITARGPSGTVIIESSSDLHTWDTILESEKGLEPIDFEVSPFGTQFFRARKAN